MKVKSLVSIPLLFCVFSLANADMQDNMSSTVASAPATQGKDGQILESLTLIDNNEINAGKVAAKRSSNEKVKEFAQNMIDDHSKNLEAVEKLSQKIKVAPVDTARTNVLSEKGKKDLQALESTPSNQFDMTYMSEMVKGHEKVLAIIDDKMLHNVSNAELADLLKSTRQTVAHHLEMAKEVKSNLTAK